MHTAGMTRRERLSFVFGDPMLVLIAVGLLIKPTLVCVHRLLSYCH